jgi:hypothetical protein
MVDEDELEIYTARCLQLVGCILVVQAYEDLHTVKSMAHEFQ